MLTATSLGIEGIGLPSRKLRARSSKPGEWHDHEASVGGNYIVIHRNGVHVADYNDASPKLTDGAIGLQIHTGGGLTMINSLGPSGSATAEPGTFSIMVGGNSDELVQTNLIVVEK